MLHTSDRTKYRAIAAELRAQLLNGSLPAGARMPTRETLIQRYGTTKVTLQKAFDLLAEQGWIETAGRRGTFVKAQANRRHDYALVFPWPRERDVSQFYRVLRQQAAQLTTAHRRITCFNDISGHVDTEDYQRLQGLVRSHRLAGVIFASSPHLVQGLAALEEPGVPRVLIATPSTTFQLPSVYPDLAGFCARAIRAFATAGRRRLAVIALADDGRTGLMLDQLSREAAAHGMRIESRWIQAAPATAPHWARHAAEMLFAPGASPRPDALLITDDNLVPAATAGLRAAGVQTPTEVLVIAHTNFPYPMPAAVPVTRLGFDISLLLALCVERIDQQRRGETPPAATWLPVVTESEVKQSVLFQSTLREGVSA